MTNSSNWIGIDDHADKWTIAQYRGEQSEPEREWELEPSDNAYRKLIGWLKGLKGTVRVVYEAGPCGYELYRRLRRAGIECSVAAPSLTPRKPGDRVKTNRRDARKLGRLLRAGELTLITVPDSGQEAVRDLIRAREAASKDLLRSRHQLSKLLLRYGHRFREGKAWSLKFWTWLRQIELSEQWSREVMRHLMTAVEQRVALVAEYDKSIEEVSKTPQYAPLVKALGVLRGVDRLTAMTVLVELGDLRRFTTAPQLMGALGLVPSEYSTGDKVTRSSITKTGNTHVRRVIVEAAWQYQRYTRPGPRIRQRRLDQPDRLLTIATRCDQRLHKRFTRLTSRGKRSTLAAVAVARELTGFIWAIGQLMY